MPKTFASSSSVRLPASPLRCAWCHATLEPVERVACASCLASHHPECWSEDRCCATCRHEVALERRKRATPEVRPQAPKAPRLAPPAAALPSRLQRIVVRFLQSAAILAVAFVILLIVACFLNVAHGRRSANEARAIGILKTLSTAESTFVDDPNSGKAAHAGTIGQLAARRLIDPAKVLGDKDYIVQLVVEGPASSRWWAIAIPRLPGESGDRAFFMSHRGVYPYRSVTAGEPVDLSFNGDFENFPPGFTPLD